MTMLHHMIEGAKESSYWTHDSLIQAVIGIWFAASHQPWIVCSPNLKTVKRRLTFISIKNLHFIFLELCGRPEYVKLIREELADQDSLDYAHLSKLPILDSFIKESARFNPLDKSELAPTEKSPS